MGLKQSWKKTIKNYEVPTIFKEKLLKPYFSRLKLKGPILDAGCGTGYFSEMLASRGFKVTGIDQNKVKLKNPKAKYFIGDISKTKFNKESFNSILLINILSCVDSEKERIKIFSELKRLIKKEGKIYVINTSEKLFRKGINSKVFSFYTIGDKKVHVKLKKINGKYIEFDDYIITEKEMKTYVKKTNLRIIRIIKFIYNPPKLEVYKIYILE